MDLQYDHKRYCSRAPPTIKRTSTSPRGACTLCYLSPVAISPARESLSSSTHAWKLTGYTPPCPHVPYRSLTTQMPKKKNCRARGRGGTTCPPEELNVYMIPPRQDTTSTLMTPRPVCQRDLPEVLARTLPSSQSSFTSSNPLLSRVCPWVKLVSLAILQQVFLCVCIPARWRRVGRFQSRLDSPPSRHGFKRRTASCRRDCSLIKFSLNTTQQKDDVLCAPTTVTLYAHGTWHLLSTHALPHRYSYSVDSNPFRVPIGGHREHGPVSCNSSIYDTKSICVRSALTWSI